MIDGDFDGIVIGSGHHGLILAAYLARQGLRIGLLERRLMFGGGLSTVEPGPPGFYQNPHSINHFNIGNAPWYSDLGLEATVRYVTPRYDFAQPHADGTALVFSRDIDETCASIARFSKRDAETFREWNRRADAISDAIFLAERYSEPLPEAERDELLSLSEVGRDFLSIIERQPLDLVNELFESEPVRLLLLFKLSLFGTVLYDAISKRSPMGAAIRGFDLAAGYQVCVGGSWNLARGLMESFLRNGGVFVNHAEVERIVVEGNRATGVELVDGRAFRARELVASTLDVPQTFTRLVGSDQLPADYRVKVAAFKQTNWTLLGIHLALRALPDYASSRFDPNIGKALKYNIGCESMEQLFALHEEVAMAQIPSRVSFGTGHITYFDPSQAPAGHHTAYGWHAMPYAPDGDPANIEDAKAEFAQRMIEKWREYAPNLTPENILHTWIYTANDYARELINMVGGDIFMGSFAGDQTMWNHFGYRTPISNLYMAGSPTHPGGAISGGGGYIASRVIVDDLGLKPWWTPVDAREALLRAARVTALSPRDVALTSTRGAACSSGEGSGRARMRREDLRSGRDAPRAPRPPRRRQQDGRDDAPEGQRGRRRRPGADGLSDRLHLRPRRNRRPPALPPRPSVPGRGRRRGGFQYREDRHDAGRIPLHRSGLAVRTDRPGREQDDLVLHASPTALERDLLHAGLEAVHAEARRPQYREAAPAHGPPRAGR
jgi:phytoene dehydrogenase-like protein